jgi:hypothetical protein
MLSRITIEVAFDRNNLPVIQIIETPSPDVRDKLLSHFLQSLQHTSRWCRIEYLAEDSRGRIWQIHPITPQDIPEELKLMTATHRNTTTEP